MHFILQGGAKERDEWTMARRDNKGRILRTGESQRNDGRYDYRYTDSVTGKRKTVYSADLAKLREKEKKIQRDVEDGIIMDSGIRKLDVNTLFEQYLSLRKLVESTRVNYIRQWELHVKDNIGSMKVIYVRPSHIKALYAKMSQQNYARNTIKIIHSLILPTFEMAVDDNIIRKNPAKNALMDYGEEAGKKNALTQDEQRNLLQFVETSPIYNVYLPMIQIFIGTAMRCGELIGLTWDDVSFDENVISIDHQLVYKDFKDGNGYCFHLHKTKTEAGTRVIPMTDSVKKAFLQQRKIQFLMGAKRDVEVEGLKGFVFTGRNGMPMMPAAVNNVLYNIVKAYNRNEQIRAMEEKRKAKLLPKFSVHVLRHTGCTRMAEKGIDAKVLQYVMGHSDIAVTMEVYNHIEKRRVETEIQKMNVIAG